MGQEGAEARVVTSMKVATSSFREGAAGAAVKLGSLVRCKTKGQEPRDDVNAERPEDGEDPQWGRKRSRRLIVEWGNQQVRAMPWRHACQLVEVELDGDGRIHARDDAAVEGLGLRLKKVLVGVDVLLLGLVIKNGIDHGELVDLWRQPTEDAIVLRYQPEVFVVMSDEDEVWN